MYQRSVCDNSASLGLTQPLPRNISPTFTQIVAFDVQGLAEITPGHLWLQKDSFKHSAPERMHSPCSATPWLLASDFKAICLFKPVITPAINITPLRYQRQIA